MVKIWINLPIERVFILKCYKYLNLKGVTLDKEQLQNYMEKIAVNYEIDMKSDVETYPINRLMDNI